MKYTKYPELKNELKLLAKEIKKWKYNRDHWYETDKRQWHYQYGVMRRANDFRHKHIAYCMLRGRQYEEIERSCHNKPDMRWVKEIIEKYEQSKAELGAV